MLLPFMTVPLPVVIVFPISLLVVRVRVVVVSVTSFFFVEIKKCHVIVILICTTSGISTTLTSFITGSVG